MRDKKFKLRYAPARRAVFSKEKAGRCRTFILEKINGFGVEIVGIDWLNDEGFLFNNHGIDD